MSWATRGSPASVKIKHLHALTHEVTYGTLLQDRRRALHARIVAAIEQLYAARLGEQMELLTHHAVRGEAWEKAVVYLREAGAKAFRRSANADAVSYFTKGLEIVERLPEGAGRRMVAFHRYGCHVIPHRQT